MDEAGSILPGFLHGIEKRERPSGWTAFSGYLAERGLADLPDLHDLVRGDSNPPYTYTELE